MTDEAISTFLFLTDISYDFGLITQRVFNERIVTLYELNELDIEDFYDLHIQVEINDNFQPDNQQRNDYQELNLDELGLGNAVKINAELYSKDDRLFFITGQQGKYCKWKFNEYDADDKPSIPHGHGIERRKIKLDPYRAQIFDIDKGFDKPIAKEDKELIKYLWNNNDFRNLATIAIKHHIANLNKHHLYWTNYRGLTHSPLRLPRRRR